MMLTGAVHLAISTNNCGNYASCRQDASNTLHVLLVIGGACFLIFLMWAIGQAVAQDRLKKRRRLPAVKPLADGDPRRLGGFEVLGRVGSGGMGVVYLGRSRGGRLAAVKVVRSELADDAGFRARFGQEIVAARQVGGSFTAPVLDADPDAGQPWLATLFIRHRPGQRRLPGARAGRGRTGRAAGGRLLPRRGPDLRRHRPRPLRHRQRRGPPGPHPDRRFRPGRPARRTRRAGRALPGPRSRRPARNRDGAGRAGALGCCVGGRVFGETLDDQNDDLYPRVARTGRARSREVRGRRRGAGLRADEYRISER